MDFEDIQHKLNVLPIGRSQFEFETFNIEQYPTSGRLVAAALLEMENLHIAKNKILLNQSSDNISPQDIRQLKIIDNQLDQWNKWYEKLSNDIKNVDRAKYEEQESTYWINILAKQAAIELMATERTSVNTLQQMSCLSTKDFAECVRLCVEIVKTIKTTTSIAENTRT